MSQLTNRATAELRSIKAPVHLFERTMGSLPTFVTKQRKRNGVVVLTIGVAAVAIGLVLVMPQIATALAVNSIQSAIEAKVRHTRKFGVIDGREVLLSETWDEGNRHRRESFIPEYQPHTLRQFATPTGHSLHVETVITDRKSLLRLVHQSKKAYLQPYTRKYVSTGFDLESVLRDMGGRQNLTSVDIEVTSIDNQQVLVARFANRLANYTLYCDPETRLPFKMDVVSPPLFPGDETTQNVNYYSFPKVVDADLFSMNPPKGYRLVDSD